MKKFALASAVGVAALLAAANAQAAPVNTAQHDTTVAKSTLNTDVSSRARYRVYRRHFIGPRVRLGFGPYYDSYAYDPYPYGGPYYGGPYYGGPAFSFSFGGGGFHRGWHRW